MAIDISETASTIKDMWSLFSDANEIAKKTENLELQKMLNDLQGQIILLERELNEKNKIIFEFEKLQQQEEELIFDKNVYWKETEEGRKGPYCSKCKGENEKLILMKTKVGSGNSKFWRCPVCNDIELYERGNPVVKREKPKRRGRI